MTVDPEALGRGSGRPQRNENLTEEGKADQAVDSTRCHIDVMAPLGSPCIGPRDRGAHSRGPLATNEVTLAIATLASVAVRDHDIVRSVVGPDEADTGLIVDSDGMLARPVFGQLLKSVAGRTRRLLNSEPT